MSSKTPVYVAGLLLGVLPIGLWSISIILSIFPSTPLTDLTTVVSIFSLFKIFFTELNKISFTNVDLPLPETPVTPINLPSGNLLDCFS